jgi:hypothetical protein
MVIAVPDLFAPFMVAAVARVQAQFPAIELRVVAENIEIIGAGFDDVMRVRSAIMHSLYREKIYTETLPMRTAMLAALTK